MDDEKLCGAARFVWDGGSPYDRATYRYTPLLAWLLVPNVLGQSHHHHHHQPWSMLAECWGKLVFVVADIVVALLMKRILRWEGGVSEEKSDWLVGLGWLWNPLVFAISTVDYHHIDFHDESLLISS